MAEKLVKWQSDGLYLHQDMWLVRMYNYYVENIDSEFDHMNLCVFMRTALIWAPLAWIFKPRETKKTKYTPISYMGYLLMVCLLIWVIFSKSEAGISKLSLVGCLYTLVGLYIFNSYNNQLWDHGHNEFVRNMIIFIIIMFLSPLFLLVGGLLSIGSYVENQRHKYQPALPAKLIITITETQVRGFPLWVIVMFGVFLIFFMVFFKELLPEIINILIALSILGAIIGGCIGLVFLYEYFFPKGLKSDFRIPFLGFISRQIIGLFSLVWIYIKSVKQKFCPRVFIMVNKV